jgi:hypothetical protein
LLRKEHLNLFRQGSAGRAAGSDEAAKKGLLTMKRLLIVTSMTLMLVGIAVSAAFGQTGIVIPLDTVVRAAPGSLTVLAVVDTPSDLVGSTCQGLGVTQNQDSVHPNNDIIMESGATVAVFEDVEETPDKVTTASGPVTLGDTVTLTLRMGSDGVFSGGMAVFVDVDCLAPPTTTTLPETPVKPEIEIVKTANPEFYGDDGIGHFSIAVTNPGPVDLTNVRVTDDDALAIDPNSNCPREVGDLAVGEEVEYECTISGLDGVSPYPNEAIAIGIGPDGTEVTDSSRAIVFPAVQDTTVTTTTQATIETLPVTGIASDQTRDLTLAGLALVVSGMLILGGLALSGRYRQDL